MFPLEATFSERHAEILAQATQERLAASVTRRHPHTRVRRRVGLLLINAGRALAGPALPSAA
jgi:hypothetical protein